MYNFEKKYYNQRLTHGISIKHPKNKPYINKKDLHMNFVRATKYFCIYYRKDFKSMQHIVAGMSYVCSIAIY